ncbi:MAG: glycosyltransferase N-terminal domain-containing protein [Flavihumibacter sp.]
MLLYTAGVRVAAFFNPKAKLWLLGRQHWAKRLGEQLPAGQKRPVLWMHCASLGEFEQGRPVLEEIKTKYPDYQVLISFFSPSGYEACKNYPGADQVVYLPMDSAKNARRFLQLVQPALVLWIRYEFWYYYLHELQKKKIPVVLVSGLFRRSQPFFRWYGALHRHMLYCFNALFLQQQESVDLVKSIGLQAAFLTGDTRFDRVSATAANPICLPEIEAFINGRKTLVAGSTWLEDEEELDHYCNTRTDYCYILAPHEIGEAHLQDLEKLVQNSIRYSAWKNRASTDHSFRVLVIDNIGLLSRLYKYADLAYVGGGFGDDGLHNTLEAAVFGIPVLFGPNYEDFPEAVALIKRGAGFSVETALELEKLADELFANENSRRKAAEAAAAYVNDNKGASKKIIHYLEANRLLTN